MDNTWFPLNYEQKPNVIDKNSIAPMILHRLIWKSTNDTIIYAVINKDKSCLH